MREKEAFDVFNSKTAKGFLKIARIYQTRGETGIAFRLAKSQHKWLYDEHTLGELLRRSISTNVKKCLTKKVAYLT